MIQNVTLTFNLWRRRWI